MVEEFVPGGPGSSAFRSSGREQNGPECPSAHLLEPGQGVGHDGERVVVGPLPMAPSRKIIICRQPVKRLRGSVSWVAAEGGDLGGPILGAEPSSSPSLSSSSLSLSSPIPTLSDGEGP